MISFLDRTLFEALGTTCSVGVVTEAVELPLARRAAAAARDEVAACERVLSRFDPASDLSRANAAAGTWVSVDTRLVDALAVALDARVATGGRCDPCLLPALRAIGYDGSYETLAERSAQTVEAVPRHVELDRRRCRIRVPRGGAIDLGASAKGWIAGRAVSAARRVWPRVRGVVVDLGGDVAAVGQPPGGGRWRIEVEDPRAPATRLGVVRITAGGAATSGTGVRRFGRQRSLHHLLDPETLTSAAAGPLAATAVAADPVAADAHATALAVLPVEAAASYVADRPGLGAVLVVSGGPPLVLGEIDFASSNALEATP